MNEFPPAFDGLVDHPPTVKSAYRPELDALRFVAFFLVFLHHVLPRHPDAYASAAVGRCLAALANACGYGLSLFFVLSAFLITDVLLRERAVAGRVQLRTFYVRRALRIWPLYTVGLMLGAIVAICGPQHGELFMLGMYLAFVGNFYFIGGDWPNNPATPLWSISIEEQFYLFWPLVVGRFAGSRLYAACGGLALCGLAAQAAFGRAHADLDTTVWTNSLVQFEVFAAGAALAIHLRGRIPSLPLGERAALLVLAAASWLASVTVFTAKTMSSATSASDLVIGYALVTLGALALLVCALGTGVERTSPWVRLGRISFGLYVFHLLFIEVARGLAPFCPPLGGPELMSVVLQLCSLAPTVLTATFCHRIIEQPFLRLKDRFIVVLPPETTHAGIADQSARTTSWRCSPSPVQPNVTTSPGLR